MDVKINSLIHLLHHLVHKHVFIITKTGIETYVFKVFVSYISLKNKESMEFEKSFYSLRISINHLKGLQGCGSSRLNLVHSVSVMSICTLKLIFLKKGEMFLYQRFKSFLG